MNLLFVPSGHNIVIALYPQTECIAYPAVRKFIVMNNSHEKQTTTVHEDEGRTREVTLGPAESKWFDF